MTKFRKQDTNNVLMLVGHLKHDLIVKHSMNQLNQVKNNKSRKITRSCVEANSQNLDKYSYAYDQEYIIKERVSNSSMGHQK